MTKITVQRSKDAKLAAAGVALLIAALIVWMINWMYRLSTESNVDREREELAREYFDRHGHWPGETEAPHGRSGSGRVYSSEHEHMDEDEEEAAEDAEDGDRD